MVLRQPGHHHGGLVCLQLLDNQREVVSEVFMRDHHTLGVAGGTGSVLQEGNVLRSDGGQCDGRLGLAVVHRLALFQSIVDTDPFELGPASTLGREDVLQVHDLLGEVVR